MSFLVGDRMQCDNCTKWYHNVCTGLISAAYKRCCKLQSRLLIRAAIQLIARKVPSDKQPVADDQPSVFVKVASFIMSPALALNRTIKVDPNSVADSKHRCRYSYSGKEEVH